MSAFERAAVQRLIDQAAELGVSVPDRITHLASTSAVDPSGGAAAYVASLAGAEPPIEAIICCTGASLSGDPARCYCWTPVYELEQAPPRLPSGERPLVRPHRGLCDDCAYRRGSPEKADVWLAETLQDLVYSGQPFWCHQGMRRPVAWTHPTLGEVPGDPSDWHPPTVTVAGVGPVPFRADGQPALLCGGWSHPRFRALAAEAVEEGDSDAAA